MKIKREVGFTLIEIMLVLVLLSVSSMAVIMSLPESSDDQLEEQASRFYQLVQLLNEDALLNGMDYGIYFNQERQEYRFMTLTVDGWQPLEKSRFFTEVKMEEDIAFEMELGGSAWADDDRLFEPGSLFDEEMFADVEEKKKPKPPQVMVLSSGEVTPVIVRFLPANERGNLKNKTWEINVDESGLIALIKPGESVDD
ncbi:prepilin-type N-terminal cleavage/methylation domain-containing protein [Aliivibrio sp. 1S128]|uniref:prepilin-type N-terminal cleavage/methylation domain-containing protein n=1 Tax=Aliivibrio sp. 1S128 TaxID=1840085 RepID=UPI00080EC203|nr:prepilin-type N-terminal cleavage/methylation domain-containing protein [Aliivibrio sp. 1S128]OCH20647.1 type II secretion system protein GspH [Aliivibrio sp. 1S128]